MRWAAGATVRCCGGRQADSKSSLLFFFPLPCKNGPVVPSGLIQLRVGETYIVLKKAWNFGQESSQSLVAKSRQKSKQIIGQQNPVLLVVQAVSGHFFFIIFGSAFIFLCFYFLLAILKTALFAFLPAMQREAFPPAYMYILRKALGGGRGAGC